MTTETRRYKFLGNSDEVFSCDCCGRADLKSTVGLEDLETGATVYFGVVCAARAVGITTKAVTAKARAADNEKAAREAAALEAARKIADGKWQTFLDRAAYPLVGSVNRFQQIQKLGGMSAARARLAAEASS